MSAPLHLSQVLEEEYEALHGPIPHGERTWLLGAGDLPAPAALAAALRDPAREVSRHLRAHLPPALLDGGPVEPGALVAALNTLLAAGRLLYDPARISGVALRAEVRALIRQRPEREDLVHVNRLLLEAAYPDLVACAHDARLAAIWRRVHALPQRRAALCLSGGGIRSATFALGLLQGFARAGFLGRFDFLSTVSGGGYLGGWLSAWSRRHPQGAAGVVAALAAPPASGVAPEARPVHRLRAYSNYLNPRLGLLSADTWALVAIYLRNLLLNWLVLVPLLAAVLALPRLVVAAVRWAPPLPLPVGWTEAMLLLGFALSVVALAYTGYERPSHDAHRSRTSGPAAFFGWCLVPLVAAALALTLYWAWRSNTGQPAPGLIAFVVFGSAIHLCAAVAWSVLLRHWDPVELVVIATTGALGGVAGWLVTRILPEPVEAIALRWAAFAVPAAIGVVLAAATIFVGLASAWTTDEDREWWARAGAWLLIAMVGWAGLSALVIWGPVWIAGVQAWVASLGGVSFLVTVLLGGSGRTAGVAGTRAANGLAAALRERAPALAAPVLAGCLAVFLSIGTNWLLVWLNRARWLTPGGAARAASLPDDPALHLRIVAEADAPLLLTLLALLLGLSLLMSAFVDVNKFSLHAMYRNRLIRAYLGASRPARRPNPFTGFDPADDVPLRDLRGVRPLHVVNIALNLVGGSKLAWQERKAETFTATALHAGSYHLGYRPVATYGAPRDGISLGTALAISGAAASPNMGYHSSPAVTVLMTLFNARLGWWLGNPGVAGTATHAKASPTPAFGPILAEAFGLTDDCRPYVYLSDGGHFDNLGLVEMVLRRCHVIVVSDAGCDPQYALDDLGGAIRKIRIDLGVPIALGPLRLRPRGQGPGAYCALGRIGYSHVDGTPPDDDGWLVYLKPAVYGDEPADVLAYARRRPAFPQEPTADQWFSESQFESYRRLGLHVVEAIFGAGFTGTLDDFVARAEQHVSHVQ